ncbi:Nucleoside diphosphate-linked moiety X motif 19, mitochondrial [Stylosanthes scabra]|uniref:NAD(+) diphosphatase n=1 Tax=Stylosanthes scabra TaxID=79078 RepID=A0ABU6QPH9_9FABA|nr:Nucleoside diphosphate-linked moiety X motif 19, mitochondrial [Stylosanthes scabra]
MSINLHTHTFAGNPLHSKSHKSIGSLSPSSAFEALNARILGENSQLYRAPLDFKVLPFRNGKALASSAAGPGGDSPPIWNLGWIGLDDLRGILRSSGAELSAESLVYLGSEDDVVYWAIDVSSFEAVEFGARELNFVEVRTLMVAADWCNSQAMANLAVAGHAKALLEWHNTSRFCGHCGSKAVPKEAGRRKQCSNDSCKKRIYPRVDPVAIMLVIDRENDRALLAKRSKFVPRLWTCLSGFTEAGESLEEAVRRETWEETGIEVGEVVYHSSQPWPVGPNSMPCQLMVGFFAYAKSFEIKVDKEELEDAQWYSKEEVRKALTFDEYKQAQRSAAAKVEQMCKGVEKNQSLAADFNVGSELNPMFVPGPFAIAHHLISSWAFADQNVVNGVGINLKQPVSSI